MSSVIESVFHVEHREMIVPPPPFKVVPVGPDTTQSKLADSPELAPTALGGEEGTCERVRSGAHQTAFDAQRTRHGARGGEAPRGREGVTRSRR